MELGGKLLNSMIIETQFLERLKSVSVVDAMVPPTPKRMMWRVTEAESMPVVFTLSAFFIFYLLNT
jgi:hypothetical protein